METCIVMLIPLCELTLSVPKSCIFTHRKKSLNIRLNGEIGGQRKLWLCGIHREQRCFDGLFHGWLVGIFPLKSLWKSLCLTYFFFFFFFF